MTPSAKSPRAGLGPWRCDILYVAVDALLGVGAVFALWILLDSLKPSADVQALSTTAVELMAPHGPLGRRNRRQERNLA
jgi:hypothetical protein